MKSVLITGAGGFVGAAVCDELAKSDRSVVALWHRKPPRLLKNGISLQMDLANAPSLETIPEVSAICHLAAALPASFSESFDASETNRRIDAEVFSFATSRSIPIVYASGTSVIRDSKDAGEYVKQKYRTEIAGSEWSAKIGQPFTSLRISAPYGPAQRARTVLQIFADRATRGEDLTWHGSGMREQDFTWVEDVAQAFVAALDGPGGTFNVATGTPITMKALAKLIAIEAGLSPKAAHASGQVDPQDGWTARFDVSETELALGWKATIPLETGIRRVLNWHRELQKDQKQ